MGTKNFRSKASYRRWLGYGHATGVFTATPGHQRVKIRGKPHRVSHVRRKKR